MSEHIEERILDLPREAVFEVATFVAEEMSPDAEPEAEAEWVGSSPFAHVDDAEAVARLVLLGRSLDGQEGESEVETAIEGAGRKNLVLGGTEIIVLAGLGVIALRILVTKGRLTEESVEMRQNPDTGKWEIIMKKTETAVSISDDLAAVFRSFFPGANKTPSDKT